MCAISCFKFQLCLSNRDQMAFGIVSPTWKLFLVMSHMDK